MKTLQQWPTEIGETTLDALAAELGFNFDRSTLYNVDVRHYYRVVYGTKEKIDENESMRERNEKKKKKKRVERVKLKNKANKRAKSNCTTNVPITE